MTRRAKERRAQRLGQKSEEEARRYFLASRPEWLQVLRTIEHPEDQLVNGVDTAKDAVPKSTLTTPLVPVTLSNGSPKSHGFLPPAQQLEWKSTNVVIGASDVFILPIQLECASGHLTFEFAIHEYDLNFAIELIRENGTSDFVLPVKNYSAFETDTDKEEAPAVANGPQQQHDLPTLPAPKHRGELKITKGPGRILLRWDNSYSWFQSKQLAYSIKLSQSNDLPVNGLNPSSPSKLKPSTPVLSCSPSSPSSSSSSSSSSFSPRESHQVALQALLERQRAEATVSQQLDLLSDAFDQEEAECKRLQQQIDHLHQRLEEAEKVKEHARTQQKQVEDELQTLQWEIRGRNHMEQLLTITVFDCTDVLMCGVVAELGWRCVDPTSLKSLVAFLSKKDALSLLSTNKQWAALIPTLLQKTPL